ncbi:MAG TPA: extracellular solute-binding protein [Candidatus Dormibacteraeota bacterium]|nr:extracellular solute-binding protein [Candidatus Dormibacteraeota bacterium]
MSARRYLDGRLSRRELLQRTAAGAGSLALAGTLGDLLAACGGSSTTPSSGKPLSPDTSGSITVWHYSSANDLKTVQDYTALFTKKYPKITVNLQYVEFSEMPKRAIAAAAAKSGPDVFIYGGNEVNAMYKAGTFRSIDSLWSSYPDKGQFPDGVITKFGGKVYGVKGYVNLTGLWYNKDILDQVGVQPPKTFDDVTSTLAKIAAHPKKFTPIALTGQPTDQGDWTAWPWLSGFGFSYPNPDQPAIESAFSLVNEWARKGYLPKEAVTWGQAESFTRFAVGDVAFMENGNWNIGPAKRQIKFNYATAELPTGPKKSGLFLGGEAIWMGGFTKSPDIAWAYMQETLLSKPGLLITLNEAGTIPARADMADLPDVTNNTLLTPYISEVKNRGSQYPPEGGTAIAAQAVVAQNWSAVIAGQKSPSQAAKDTADGVKANFHS